MYIYAKLILEMSAFLSVRGKLVSGGAILLGLALVDYGLSFYAHRQRLGRIEQGNCFNLSAFTEPSGWCSRRQKRLEDVNLPKFYKLHSDQGFRVVIGPSGSGKTALIRDMCNLYPEGTLYLEAKNYNVPAELAKVIGLPTNTQTPTFLESLLTQVSKI